MCFTVDKGNYTNHTRKLVLGTFETCLNVLSCRPPQMHNCYVKIQDAQNNTLLNEFKFGKEPLAMNFIKKLQEVLHNLMNSNFEKLYRKNWQLPNKKKFFSHFKSRNYYKNINFDIYSSSELSRELSNYTKAILLFSQ